MKFSKAWESFKTTPKAQKFIEVFSKRPDEETFLQDIIAEYFEIMSNLGEETYPEEADYYTLQLVTNEPTNIDAETIIDYFEAYVDNLEIWYTEIQDEEIIRSTKKKDCLVQKGNYRALNSLMHIISSRLYNVNGFFKPIFFSDHFNWIQRNCELLEIAIPDVPRTKDYRKYTMYYLELCEAFMAFQEENNLTDAEFLCYLYLFADEHIDDNRDSQLPRPTNVWMTGANPYDFECLENGEITDSAWACNEKTQRGDIIIVYAVTPNSCFHSIWRADSGGCFNPFNYYHCRTTVVDCHPIPHVTFKEFMADPILSNFTIGRKKLQGVNGFELSASEYSAFLNYLADKGCNTEELPQLVMNTDWERPEIVKGTGEPEKQVENKFIIPLLRDVLGYKEGDYTQQARHKSGRKEKSIPDFVFFQSGEHGLEHCPFLIEAK